MTVATHDPEIELQVDGTYTEISDDVHFDGGVRHERGRSGEGDPSVDPSQADMGLKSPAGKYSPRNPLSPYYGKIGRNTPVRASTAGAGVVLYLPPDSATAGVTTPDNAALDITGDIDVRADLTPAAWAGSFTSGAWEVMGKYTTVGNQRSYLMLVDDDGEIEFRWSNDGTALLRRFSTAPVPHLGGHRGAIRATLDVNNGAAGHTVTFYTAPTMAGPWTVLGDPVVTAGTTSIFSGTAALEVGDISILGFGVQRRHFHSVEVRNGIDGTAVANPVFADQTIGASSFADDAGRTWTVVAAAEITDRRFRFTTEVPEWRPSWEVGSDDVSSTIQGAGILRRMSQGEKALESTLRRRIPTFSPLAYWPCEDADGATQAASAVVGGFPLFTSGGWDFAQNDDLAGSKPLPSVEAGSTMQGDVPAPVTPTDEWSVSMMYTVDATPASDAVFLSWYTSGTIRRWRIVMGPTGSRAQGYDDEGTLVLNQVIGTGTDIFDGWWRLHFWVTQDGSDVEWHLNWWNVDGDAGGFSDTLVGDVGRVTQVYTQFGASVTGLHVGHIGVFEVGNTAAYSLADHGFNAETAGARLVRLCEEEGIPFRAVGAVTDTTAMGPQQPDTALNLLRECEEADGGILHEDREELGLVYRNRTELYNQEPALTLTWSQINQPFEPVDDDSRIRNDVTRSRLAGSSARVVLEEGPLSVQPPPLGVGTYDESVPLNLHNDSQPLQIAAWAMHLGTWDEARYKRVRVLLHKWPELIEEAVEVREGDIIRITDTPDFLPPGPYDLLVEGYSEDFTGLTWEIIFVCAPGGPWTVGVTEDPIVGRADTDGSELAAAIDSDDTHLVVTVTEGPLWVTDLAELPFDVTLGGEEVTVTAITGELGDQFDRSEVNGWGTATSGQAWTTSGGTADDYSVQGG